MLHAEGCDFVAVHLDHFLRRCHLVKYNRERQLRADDAQRIDDALQAFWADHGQRFSPVSVSHRQEKSWKAADVVCVVMGEADGINRLKGPAFFLDGNLGSLAAVDQKAASVVSGHQGGQASAWQRHHTACSQ